MKLATGGYQMDIIVTGFPGKSVCHGTLGWTMGPGSGRLIADLIDGKTPAIDVSDLGLARFPAGQGI